MVITSRLSRRLSEKALVSQSPAGPLTRSFLPVKLRGSIFGDWQAVAGIRIFKKSAGDSRESSPHWPFS